MDKQKQPGILIRAIFLKEIQFERTPKINGGNIDFGFKSSYSISPDKKRLEYELSCDVSDLEQNMKFHCAFVGIFETSEDDSNMTLEEYSKTNAAACMLPYIRELVTTTTARAGLNPLVLPPVNVSALIKERSDNNGYNSDVVCTKKTP